jgi:carbon storage regulator
MLVISRKKGQAINIGHNIKIVVVDNKKDTVKIGIEAPSDVDIYRAEIYAEIQNENLKAMAKQDVYRLLQQGFAPKGSDEEK